MVNGLERFKQYFALYIDQYVLIGGVACSVLMEEAGLDEAIANYQLDILVKEHRWVSADGVNVP